ncbi:MAG: alpha/beta hydrolase [Cyanobacteria bacterium Co-bin13]|nr:alpha/beta hydrolase [Cyanobacteria bacterium Co-bin13]
MSPSAPQLQQRRVIIDGLSIFTRLGGQQFHAPAIVLVHGMGVSSRYMVPLAEVLAGQYPVFAPDLPGYGSSDEPGPVLGVLELADFLDRWMDAMGLEQAIFLGNSFGCQIIAEFALRHPLRIDKAILLGPTTDRHARTFPKQLWRFIRDAPNERLSLGWVLLREYLRSGPRRLIRNIQMTLADSLEKKLPGVQVPTLIIRGERDPLVSQLWVEELVGLLPQGQLVVLPGAGHVPNYSHPAALMQAIEPFLRPVAAPTVQ